MTVQIGLSCRSGLVDNLLSRHDATIESNAVLSAVRRQMGIATGAEDLGCRSAVDGAVFL